MTSWEKLDQRLAALGKDRAWLADKTPYSLESIRNAMAPASTRRSDRMLSILSRAIEDEELAQSAAAPREVRPGVFEIFQSEEQLHTADIASRIVGAASISDFCRDVIITESERIIAAEARIYPETTIPNLKVAGPTDQPRAKDPTS